MDQPEKTNPAIKPAKTSRAIKIEIKDGILQIFSEVTMDNLSELKNNYWDIGKKLSAEELQTEKWRTYIYLKKCVLDYRAGNQDRLLMIINFIERNNANKTWLSKKLLDNPTQATEEKWSSGKHEWLERSLIADVLKRCAGMEPAFQKETQTEGTDTEIDWLYVQAELRSPTKYLFFKNPENAILSGHDGAVRTTAKKGKKGSKTKGSYQFHEKLEQAFHESHHIASFLLRIEKVFKGDTISGKKELDESSEAGFVIDGTSTTDKTGINVFRKNKLHPDGYKPTSEKMKALFTSSSVGGSTPLSTEEDVHSDTTPEEPRTPVAKQRAPSSVAPATVIFRPTSPPQLKRIDSRELLQKTSNEKKPSPRGTHG